MGEINFGDGDKRQYNMEFPKPDETQLIEKDYYVILGVKRGASIEEVKAAYDSKVLDSTNIDAHKFGGVLKSEGELADLKKMIPKWKEARDAIINELEEERVTDELPNLEQFKPALEQAQEKLEESRPSSFKVEIGYNYFERQKLRIPEIWRAIEKDKQFKAILAFCILDDGVKSKFIDNRDFMSQEQVANFYTKYPNMEYYNANSKVMELPSYVSTTDKNFVLAKRQEYFNSIDRFTRLMYPESFEKK